MGKHPVLLGLMAAVCVASMACDTLDKLTAKNPTSPSPTAASLNAFAGTWASISVAAPATGCGNLKYTVCGIPVSGSEIVKKP